MQASRSDEYLPTSFQWSTPLRTQINSRGHLPGFCSLHPGIRRAARFSTRQPKNETLPASLDRSRS